MVDVIHGIICCHFVFQFNIRVYLWSDWLPHLHQKNLMHYHLYSCLFFCTWTRLMLHLFFLFIFPRLLNFGQRESFVVTVATQSLVATSASSALRKILRIQKIVITITLKVPIAHVEGLIQIQKLRSKLKWYNAICEDWFHEDHIGLNSIEEVIYLQLSYLMALYLLTSFYVLFLLYLHGCILYAIVPLYTSVAQKIFLVVMSFLLVNVLFCF